MSAKRTNARGRLHSVGRWASKGEGGINCSVATAPPVRYARGRSSPPSIGLVLSRNGRKTADGCWPGHRSDHTTPLTDRPYVRVPVTLPRYSFRLTATVWRRGAAVVADTTVDRRTLGARVCQQRTRSTIRFYKSNTIEIRCERVNSPFIRLTITTSIQ